jgi:hypothetical protein
MRGPSKIPIASCRDCTVHRKYSLHRLVSPSRGFHQSHVPSRFVERFFQPANATFPENVAFILQTLRTGPTDYDRISVAFRITTVHFLRSPRSSREEYLLD